MNKLDLVFENITHQPKAIYTVVGYPDLEKMYEVYDGLIDSKVDIIELGMPFSDPVADGPVIQKAHEKALTQELNFQHFFESAKYIKEKSNISVVGMGYLNPILSYGIKNFLEECSKSGVTALIIPDLPPEEYENHFKELFEITGIYPIFLVSPNTSSERIKYIDSLSKGFLYAVSGLSVTGTLRRDSNEQNMRADYLKKLSQLNLINPLMVGFGISTKQDLEEIYKFNAGGIIGTAFLKVIENTSTIKTSVKQFIESLL